MATAVTAPADSDPDAGGPPRVLLFAALAVAVAAIAAILFIAANRQSPQPVAVAVADVPAPHAGGPECRALAQALPRRLGDYQRATVAQPAPKGAAAWQSAPGAEPSEPVVLRCGLDRPADFVVGSPIQIVDRVQWYEARGSAAGQSIWYTVDRPVYVALTLPSGSGPTPIQEVSDLVDRTIAAVPINPGPSG